MDACSVNDKQGIPFPQVSHMIHLGILQSHLRHQLPSRLARASSPQGTGREKLSCTAPSSNVSP